MWMDDIHFYLEWGKPHAPIAQTYIQSWLASWTPKMLHLHEHTSSLLVILYVSKSKDDGVHVSQEAGYLNWGLSWLFSASSGKWQVGTSN
jgi:hypothetical protein